MTLDTARWLRWIGDKRMIALLHQALAKGLAFRVPSGVLAQA